MKKQILILSTTCLLAFGALSFTSCGDRENQQNQNEITDIKLTFSNKIKVGSSSAIKVEVVGSKTNSVTFTSSDTSILGVNDKGLVTGYKVGKATITVTSTENTKISKTAEIEVYDEIVSSLNLSTNNESSTLTFDEANNQYLTTLGSEIKISFVNKGEIKYPVSLSYSINDSELEDLANGLTLVNESVAPKSKDGIDVFSSFATLSCDNVIDAKNIVISAKVSYSPKELVEKKLVDEDGKETITWEIPEGETLQEKVFTATLRVQDDSKKSLFFEELKGKLSSSKEEEKGKLNGASFSSLYQEKNNSDEVIYKEESSNLLTLTKNGSFNKVSENINDKASTYNLFNGNDSGYNYVFAYKKDGETVSIDKLYRKSKDVSTDSESSSYLVNIYNANVVSSLSTLLNEKLFGSSSKIIKDFYNLSYYETYAKSTYEKSDNNGITTYKVNSTFDIENSNFTYNIALTLSFKDSSLNAYAFDETITNSSTSFKEGDDASIKTKSYHEEYTNLTYGELADKPSDDINFDINSLYYNESTFEVSNLFGHKDKNNKYDFTNEQKYKPQSVTKDANGVDTYTYKVNQAAPFGLPSLSSNNFIDTVSISYEDPLNPSIPMPSNGAFDNMVTFNPKTNKLGTDHEPGEEVFVFTSVKGYSKKIKLVFEKLDEIQDILITSNKNQDTTSDYFTNNDSVSLHDYSKPFIIETDTQEDVAEGSFSLQVDSGDKDGLELVYLNNPSDEKYRTYALKAKKVGSYTFSFSLLRNGTEIKGTSSYKINVVNALTNDEVFNKLNEGTYVYDTGTSTYEIKFDSKSEFTYKENLLGSESKSAKVKYKIENGLGYIDGDQELKDCSYSFARNGQFKFTTDFKSIVLPLFQSKPTVSEPTAIDNKGTGATIVNDIVSVSGPKFNKKEELTYDKDSFINAVKGKTFKSYISNGRVPFDNGPASFVLTFDANFKGGTLTYYKGKEVYSGEALGSIKFTIIDTSGFPTITLQADKDSKNNIKISGSEFSYNSSKNSINIDLELGFLTGSVSFSL